MIEYCWVCVCSIGDLVLGIVVIIVLYLMKVSISLWTPTFYCILLKLK